MTERLATREQASRGGELTALGADNAERVRQDRGKRDRCAGGGCGKDFTAGADNYYLCCEFLVEELGNALDHVGGGRAELVEQGAEAGGVPLEGVDAHLVDPACQGGLPLMERPAGGKQGQPVVSGSGPDRAQGIVAEVAGDDYARCTASGEGGA